MKLIKDKITLAELQEMAERSFGNLVKAVVDIDNEIMVVDAELHADEERYLLDHGSKQDNLWGINVYPEQFLNDFIEFDSMINIRPSQDNMTRGIESEEVRQKIQTLVYRLVEKP